MKDKKTVLFTLLLAILLLPIGFTYAQEENIPPEEDETLMYQSAPLDGEIIPYEELENDIIYESDAQDIDIVQDETVLQGFLAAIIGYMAIVSLFGIATYIFLSLALQKIGKEMKYENTWLAWVPILQNIMIFELGEQKPWILLLMLIPGPGTIVVMVYTFIALMNITEKRGYDKNLVLIILTGIGTFILLYLLAWKPKNGKQVTPPIQQTPPPTPML